MAGSVKETVTTQVRQRNASDRIVVAPVTVEATTSQTVEYLIYFFLGLIEVLLAFRLILKLMGASTVSGFVRFIYGLTGLFILPFEGIFHKAVNEGIETVSVLEPATIVALIVYVIVAWGIIQLIHIFSGEQATE